MHYKNTDIAIVGSGAAGLWSAKELVDYGYSVTLIEKSSTLADGATTRNEGWLHAGTYHSVAVEDEEDARRVTNRTIFGHESIVRFAPESIEHDVSYAMSSDEAVIDRAMSRWSDYGVRYRPMNIDAQAAADSVDISTAQATFEVSDKSVNTVAMCEKLTQYVLERGAQIITNAEFMPVDATTADISVEGERKALHAEHFLITAGVGVNGLVRAITGASLSMRYFQAHLLSMPRQTQHNYFSLDVGEAGIMSHGNASIIGINRDGIQLEEPSYVPRQEKEALVYDAASRLLPNLKRLRALGSPVITIACCKPDIYQCFSDIQDLNVQVFPIAPGYTCALPGKMTEAPYLAKEVVRTISSSVESHVGKRRKARGVTDVRPEVTARPMDALSRLELV